MGSKPSTSTPAELPTNDSLSLSKEALSRLFADSRRRATLRALSGCNGPVELDDLAAAVADDEFDPADDHDRVLVSLYHEHLPLLADAGLLTMETRADGVFVDPRYRGIAALL